MNQKLQEIGQKLNITDRDIRGIRKAGFTGKILYWVTTTIIAIISFIIGFFGGKVTCPSAIDVTTTTITTTTSTTTTTGGGYPYAAGLLIPSVLSVKKKNSKIIILLASAIAFLITLKGGYVFGQAIAYNVYRR